MATELVPSSVVHLPVPRDAVEPGLSECQADRVRKARRSIRVRNAQERAINAPFTDISKAKFTRAGDEALRARAAGAQSAPALGLVSNETSDTRTAPVRFRINMEQKRLKRMRTSVGHAARLLHFDAHTERSAQRWNLKFITLTYADADGWDAGHFSSFRKALREWCARRNVRLRYVWVAELQTKRNVIHYHVVVWLPKGKYLPKADAQGWWPHGMTNIVTAQSPIGYITKYASKTTTEQAAAYPRGARMCGHGGLTGEGRRHIRYWQAAIWVRDALGGKADIRKVSGGYMDKITGEFLASPWRVAVSPGGEVWTYRIDQPTELAA